MRPCVLYIGPRDSPFLKMLQREVVYEGKDGISPLAKTCGVAFTLAEMHSIDSATLAGKLDKLMEERNILLAVIDFDIGGEKVAPGDLADALITHINVPLVAIGCCDIVMTLYRSGKIQAYFPGMDFRATLTEFLTSLPPMGVQHQPRQMLRQAG